MKNTQLLLAVNAVKRKVIEMLELKDNFEANTGDFFPYSLEKICSDILTTAEIENIKEDKNCGNYFDGERLTNILHDEILYMSTDAAGKGDSDSTVDSVSYHSEDCGRVTADMDQEEAEYIKKWDYLKKKLERDPSSKEMDMPDSEIDMYIQLRKLFNPGKMESK